MLKQVLFIVGVILVLSSIAGFVVVSTRFPRRTSAISVIGQDLYMPPKFEPTRSVYPFTVQVLSQVSPRGCSWSGLMGTVNDLNGKPLVGYGIRVRGVSDLDSMVKSGSSQFKGSPGYDDSTWDIPITPTEQITGVWHVQLYQPATDIPMSDAYEVQLDSKCGTSSAFVQFIQNH